MKTLPFWKEQPLALLDVWFDVGVEFDELAGRSRQIKLFETEVRIVSAADWRRLKERAGRDKDREDLDAFAPPLDDAEN